MTRAPALIVALLAAAPAAAQAPPGGDLENAQRKLARFLAGIPGAGAGTVTPLLADGIPETFPDHVLFSLRFRQFPVALLAPEPFQSSNVIAVPKGRGRPVPITGEEGLRRFFRREAVDVTDSEIAGAVVMAWLRAVAELNQDGFYRFTVQDKVEVAVKGNRVIAAGTVTVDPAGGNRGGITATLFFRNGRLRAADTDVDLSPG
ncbi:MAG: hypothetical protein C0501_31890, partial [Isosphaera sp.]|nr:hypothetical protein [Isosphaera sp.]